MSEPSVGPLTRGFLFADLRGYTAYAEAHGDRAAADLLDRYRALVRTAIAASAGAEVRTEGDSFYVVFASATAAVGAGLAIVAAAGEASAADPTTPIRVGVGVHAGEAEERAEGPVGTAVNVAARVCAEAAAGEVLVTDTVRSLVRTGGRYRFIGRGSHRLKGLTEPVALYRAVPAGEGDGAGGSTEPPRRDRRLLAVAGSGVVAIAIVAIVGLVLATRPGGPSPSPSPSPPEALASPSATATDSAGPSPSPSVAPFPNGPISPGTYQTADFAPTIRLRFGDDTWWKALELANALWLVNVGLSGELFQYDSSGPGFAGVVLFRPGIGYVGCSDDETTTLGADTAEEVIDYLARNPGLAAEAPKASSIAGLDGIAIRFRLGPPCGPITHVKPLFQLLSGVHVLKAFADQTYEVVVTEVDGEVIALWFAAPRDRWDTLARSARSLVNTLEVAP